MYKHMKIYIGWDTREDIAYQVCKHSIQRRSPDTEVVALKQHELRATGVYTRSVDPLSSTEFTFTRFLVPYLNDYKGWAVFCDCDFVWSIPAEELEQYFDETKAVVCVQHDYTPAPGVKMDGQQQLPYPRKNWSSMILWNCAHPSNRQITPDVVNRETGAYLHRFQWLDDSEIGNMPPAYNWLVSWYQEPADGTPKIYHWTEGGPWFVDTHFECDYHDVWKQEACDLFSQ